MLLNGLTFRGRCNINYIIPVVPSGGTAGNYRVTVVNGMGASADWGIYVLIYNTITVAINCDPALSITGLQYSTDNGASWLTLSTGVLYKEHGTFTAIFHATMNNPNGQSNIYFAIRLLPWNTVLASIYTSKPVQSLTTSNYTFNSDATLEFYAALP